MRVKLEQLKQKNLIKKIKLELLSFAESRKTKVDSSRNTLKFPEGEQRKTTHIGRKTRQVAFCYKVAKPAKISRKMA